jgi:predicted transcriptional regulator
VPDLETTIGVRLSAEDLRALDALAAAEQRTRSAMVRILLRERLAARQTNPPRRT